MHSTTTTASSFPTPTDITTRLCRYRPSSLSDPQIKSLLPAICPDLSYGDLSGVQDGGMAMDAFLEALAPLTSAARQRELKEQLLAYCALDTYAMVRLWQVFSGSSWRL